MPVVKGLVVDMEVRKTCLKIPSNRYNEVNKERNFFLVVVWQQISNRVHGKMYLEFMWNSMSNSSRFMTNVP